MYFKNIKLQNIKHQIKINCISVLSLLAPIAIFRVIYQQKYFCLLFVIVKFKKKCIVVLYNIILSFNLNVLLLKSMWPTAASTYMMWPSLHKRLDTPELCNSSTWCIYRKCQILKLNYWILTIVYVISSMYALPILQESF